jgi:hypothetical protein
VPTQGKENKDKKHPTLKKIKLGNTLPVDAEDTVLVRRHIKWDIGLI